MVARKLIFLAGEQEYQVTREETMSQLKDFQAFLDKALTGDLTLVDEFGAAQLAIQAAISQAFKTPEVIRMFAQKQPDQLRIKLSQLQRDLKIKTITADTFARQSKEVLIALRKLNSQLTEDEQRLLSSLTESQSQQLERAEDGVVHDQIRSQVAESVRSR